MNRVQGDIELLPDCQYFSDNVGFLADVLRWCDKSPGVDFPEITGVFYPDFNLPTQGSWCMKDSKEQAESIE